MPERSRGVDVANFTSASECNNAQDDAPHLRELCAAIHARVTNFLNSETQDPLLIKVQKQTRTTLEVLEDALNRYSLDHLSLSYNGGKDCLVLLILYLSAVHTYFSRSASSASALASGSARPHPTQLTSIYIQPPHPFDEVTEFVLSSSKDYHLSLSSSILPMRAAFTEYLQHNPAVKAIFVGTRRTDPHGGQLTHFDQTDKGWPLFMRIHPVIDWHYQEIWAFIRHFEIPYCSLYDRGFTSLGGTNDTHPNPKLRRAGSGVQGQGEVEVSYKPAYELMDDDEERLGRDW